MKGTKVFTLTNEPTGTVYQQLIETSLHFCTTALVVVRPELELSLRGVSVIRNLEPFLIGKSALTEWPGTLLYRGFAWVSRYNLVSSCARVLEESTDSLYSWRQPDLPEDICLLRPNGDPWLVTISHERDSYLSLTKQDFDLLKQTMPELTDWLSGSFDGIA